MCWAQTQSTFSQKSIGNRCICLWFRIQVFVIFVVAKIQIKLAQLFGVACCIVIQNKYSAVYSHITSNVYCEFHNEQKQHRFSLKFCIANENSCTESLKMLRKTLNSLQRHVLMSCTKRSKSVQYNDRFSSLCQATNVYN